MAPSWFHEALRADMAMMEGIDTKDVGDGQIAGWLASRNLAFQFVGDCASTRDVGLPGHLGTLRWPGHVDVMHYPAGTWFRSLSNIIEVGVLYPKEQLQINRYTEFFTEDAIAIGKRCGVSANLIPLCINGGYGAPVTITCTDTDPDSGGGSAAPRLRAARRVCPRPNPDRLGHRQLKAGAGRRDDGCRRAQRDRRHHPDGAARPEHRHRR